MNLIFRCAIAIIFMIVVLITPPGSAIAETGPFYFGIFAGYTFPENMTWHSKASGDTVSLNVDNAAMVGFKLGYVPTQIRMLAFELDFTHILDHNYGPAASPRVTEAGDVYMHNLLFNVLLRYPQGKIHPYGGAGIGSSFFNVTNFESSQGVTSLQRANTWSFCWQFLGGVNVEIASDVSIDLTYRYFGTDPHLTVADVNYRTSIISTGINLHW